MHTPVQILAPMTLPPNITTSDVASFHTIILHCHYSHDIDVHLHHPLHCPPRGADVLMAFVWHPMHITLLLLIPLFSSFNLWRAPSFDQSMRWNLAHVGFDLRNNSVECSLCSKFSCHKSEVSSFITTHHHHELLSIHCRCNDVSTFSTTLTAVSLN
jgi:hypothetical protein